jgi:hypothetical protein
MELPRRFCSRRGGSRRDRKKNKRGRTVISPAREEGVLKGGWSYLTR